MASKTTQSRGRKEISGPAGAAIVTIAVLLVCIAGYFMFVRDNSKKQTQAEVNAEMGGSMEAAQQKFKQAHFGSTAPAADQTGSASTSQSGLEARHQGAPVTR